VNSACAYRFGEFRFQPHRSELFRGEERCKLGSRAIAILALLVERAGLLVTTADIVEHVWPGIFVEENNLRVHLSALRKILGESSSEGTYIVNEPGRGYRFAVPVRQEAAVSSHEIQPRPVRRGISPPMPLGRLVGREADLDALVDRISSARLLTLVGPGGMGKTSLALSAVPRVAAAYEDGVCFIDLSPVSDAEAAPAAFAAALRISAARSAVLEDVAAELRDQRVLLLIDNCEHLAAGVAVMIERLLRTCPEISVLATSREPLRCPGEVIQTVGPLSLPPQRSHSTAQSAGTFAAVQLFSEVSADGALPIMLSDENAAVVVRICRSLDGVPLAIELGAACAGLLGLDTLADGLDDRLDLLTRGPRNLERHQSLRAMLDWSYELLDDDEILTFARLGVFRLMFDTEAAISIVAPARRADVLRSLGSLVTKSLVSIERHGLSVTYRLLETTRSYALQKLGETADRAATYRRYADYVLRGLKIAELEWTTRTKEEWWNQHGSRLDDVRNALDWAFGIDGDLGTATALAISSGQLWLGTSQLADYRTLIETLLKRMDLAGVPETRERLLLTSIVSILMFNVEGPGSAMRDASLEALRLARSLEDIPGQLASLWALMGSSVLGDYQLGMGYSREFEAVAARQGSLQSKAVAERIVALSHYRLGEFESSRMMSERSIKTDTSAQVGYGEVIRYDQDTTVRANLAPTNWMLGHILPAQAMIDASVEMALSNRNPHSLCYILADCALPLALWMEDRSLIERYIAILFETSEDNGFAYYSRRASWLSGALAIRDGRLTRDAARLRADFGNIPHFSRETLISVEPSLVDDIAVDRAVSGKAGWSTAEVLRAEGERRAAAGDRSEADALFRQAIDVAKRQRALAWELRATSSLAVLHDDYTLLAAILAQYADSDVSPDLTRGREIAAVAGFVV
jgi:predicted ATPase/DNA-binding winged helix-turn-helix (wHTH) protein